MRLTFYTPIAYDYKFSFATILSYYDIADEIILAIDKDRISWSRKKYEFDSKVFFQKIEIIDVDKKIRIFEENFHIYDEPIKNDTFERNCITTICKKENYIVGIDSDEVLLNQKEFFDWMCLENPNVDISCHWYCVYKKFKEKLLITLPNETAAIGTNLRNSFQKCRCTKLKNYLPILSPLKVLHFSWGRTRKEIEQKLLNWGHSQDFDVKKFLETWESVNLENYKEKINLHPLRIRNWWKTLELVELKYFGLSEVLLKEII